MASKRVTRSSTQEPMTPPGSITPPCAKETPGAPTKPQARRPKATATKPVVTNPRRSARIALLNAPLVEEEAGADSSTDEESTAGGTANCADPVAWSGPESDEKEEEEGSESDQSELSDGKYEEEIQARIQEAERPLKHQLLVKTAEAWKRTRDLEAKLAAVTAERDQLLERLRRLLDSNSKSVQE